MSSTIHAILSSLRPRVVIAGVPKRRPLVWKAERESNGTMFLLVVISAATSAFSATLPVSSGYLVRRSTNIEWLSVPSEMILYPLSINALAIAAALSWTCFWYSLNSGVSASPKATALAAITCSSGPPCVPGKTAESSNADIIFTSPLGVVLPHGLGKSLPIKITPPRGPRRVLWVVDVTICACLTGFSKRPAAIRPAGWAISTMKRAPISSATLRIRA